MRLTGLIAGGLAQFTVAAVRASAADSGKTHYEHQEDSQRTIVVSGDTATVSALLWAKGVEDSAKVD
jgi:hypothetical protein